MARTDWTHDELVAGVASGDRRALARAISLVENRDPRSAAVVRELYPRTGRTYAIGGATSATLTADAAGCASLEVTLAGRTALRLVPRA